MSEFKTLLQSARAVQKDFKIGGNFSAGTVAAALLTANGKIYTGVCIDLACGLGLCAEHAAIAEMIKSRETHIKSIVAVKGNRILTPCGKCRELMLQIDLKNENTEIITSEDKSALLKVFLPQHWLAYMNESQKEVGGQEGPEPTRYGDWEKNGRVSDF